MTPPRILPYSSRWTRRAWLTTTTTQTGVFIALAPWASQGSPPRHRAQPGANQARAITHAARLDPGPFLALAQMAVEAARTAGAQYADARLTRDVYHEYSVDNAFLSMDCEMVGIGVRALVNGYWGFTSWPLWGATPDRQDVVARLAREAVAQARVNAQGSPRSVDLGPVSVATGTWATPVEIDPFTISIEEKRDTIMEWGNEADRRGLIFGGKGGNLGFGRQERVVATSDGASFSQTTLQSGGSASVIDQKLAQTQTGSPVFWIKGIGLTGRGWELFRDAKIPEQLDAMVDAFASAMALRDHSKPAVVGRHTLVCDGATMAALLEQTLGIATQLDRALGYEANATGTSFLDDPLAMLGQYQVAAPGVTVTANRTAPTQLATVRWDDEGVAAPEPFPLIQDGVLTDFQTTREQAAWLAPAYQRLGRPVRSHGCAAAQNASYIPMQHMPNLALAPTPTALRLEDLVADVPQGILVERGEVLQVDSQAKTGVLSGTMREIKSGRLGRGLTNGAVLFNTLDLWKHLQVVGGAPSTMVITNSIYYLLLYKYSFGLPGYPGKGQPCQQTSHSVEAVAAIIANQPIINLLSTS